MGPENVVITETAIGQGLSFRHRGEQLGFLRAWAMNSGPLLLRMYVGAKERLVSASRGARQRWRRTGNPWTSSDAGVRPGDNALSHQQARSGAPVRDSPSSLSAAAGGKPCAVPNLGDMSLIAAVLAHHPEGERLRYPAHGALGLQLEQRLLQLSLGQKLLEANVLRLQLSSPFGILSVHAAVLLLPAVIIGLLTVSFRGEVLSPAWPDEDFHSPWSDFHKPRETSNQQINPQEMNSFLMINSDYQ